MSVRVRPAAISRSEGRASSSQGATHTGQRAAAGRGQPWSPELDAELERIAAQAREIAAQPGRLRGSVAAARRELSPGKLTVAAMAAAGTPTLRSVIAPDVSLLAALAVVGLAAWTAAGPAAGAALDALISRRPPERNAVTYLLNARRR